MPSAEAVHRALGELAQVREGLRGPGRAERAGLFSCRGCVAWCCREGSNSMRATPLEALAVARHLETSGEAAGARARLREAVERFRLAADDRERPRTYTCPFLTAENSCGVHPVKPLGCCTFNPVRDGGCDQDEGRLARAFRVAGPLNDRVFGRGRWEDLPIPVAVLRALGG